MLTAILLSLSVSLPPGPELEELFWDCDYASTQTLLSLGEAGACSEVFEAVKTDKFKGDFTAMMKWWKASKEFEHAKRAKGAKGS